MDAIRKCSFDLEMAIFGPIIPFGVTSHRGSGRKIKKFAKARPIKEETDTLKKYQQSSFSALCGFFIVANHNNKYKFVKIAVDFTQILLIPKYGIEKFNISSMAPIPTADGLPTCPIDSTSSIEQSAKEV